MSTNEHEVDKGVRLDLFANPEFVRGASRLKEICWMAVSGLLVESWLPGSGWRRQLLRAFGAQIGVGVIIKPRVRVKFPWRLAVGDHSWIGEEVWIDNLCDVTVGTHCCLSQGAYLCTGRHDWTDPSFELITAPIELGHGCWVGAKASIAPGTKGGPGAVVTMGSVASGRLKAWYVHIGVPAEAQKQRQLRIG
ncbi:colanic acid biosynthesis acetyltransferase WcaF [Sulfitobacter sp. JL08]|uniref:WcaF family extracellular polysaccharide biosynthesis acetyltransferase n=1 Tax=Sulfitobacter sp. JL08 TaxID=2070369 RepID=UPI000E0B7708|nr:WcaF family extracellular polysaccharide biosynthesis acetyltransferase [Sulfitobacter sp. JL08]AXI54092.1 colanic acid biosynthesis acetyltransferase WcaF [Sulfitobacter sp. JL08]